MLRARSTALKASSHWSAFRALCFMLRALCFVLYASCFLLCAFVLKAQCFCASKIFNFMLCAFVLSALWAAANQSESSKSSRKIGKVLGAQNQCERFAEKAQSTRHKARSTKHKAQSIKHKARSTKSTASGNRALIHSTWAMKSGTMDTFKTHSPFRPSNGTLNFCGRGMWYGVILDTEGLMCAKKEDIRYGRLVQVTDRD